MKCNAALKTLFLVSIIALAGCSGVPNGTTPPPSQNANLAVTDDVQAISFLVKHIGNFGHGGNHGDHVYSLDRQRRGADSDARRCIPWT